MGQSVRPEDECAVLGDCQPHRKWLGSQAGSLCSPGAALGQGLGLSTPVLCPCRVARST